MDPVTGVSILLHALYSVFEINLSNLRKVFRALKKCVLENGPLKPFSIILKIRGAIILFQEMERVAMNPSAII